jgi:hypothetical protein
MRNLYRVQIGYDIAVVAKGETDAENEARLELRDGNLASGWVRAVVTPLSEGMPEDWDGGCTPYGDNPDGHSINWFRNETAPVQDVTFHVIGNPNVIAQARAALEGFNVVMTTWVKEEKSG